MVGDERRGAPKMGLGLKTMKPREIQGCERETEVYGVVVGGGRRLTVDGVAGLVRDDGWPDVGLAPGVDGGGGGPHRWWWNGEDAS
ncbi:hypothetical protein U1Q18_034095 [Sarracenia purpurea var. burkii]